MVDLTDSRYIVGSKNKFLIPKILYVIDLYTIQSRVDFKSSKYT